MPLDRLSQDALGYALHTNRELGLMLRGEKPLAVFADVDGYFPDVVLRYLRMFDRHVEAGRLVKRELLEPWAGPKPPVPSPGVLVVLYALPDEEWRIDAMIRHRYSEAYDSPEGERIEGTLLGYADWQNDLWIAHQYGEVSG